jgi:hypothetical protein
MRLRETNTIKFPSTHSHDKSRVFRRISNALPYPSQQNYTVGTTVRAPSIQTGTTMQPDVTLNGNSWDVRYVTSSSRSWMSCNDASGAADANFNTPILTRAMRNASYIPIARLNVIYWWKRHTKRGGESSDSNLQLVICWTERLNTPREAAKRQENAKKSARVCLGIKDKESRLQELPFRDCAAYFSATSHPKSHPPSVSDPPGNRICFLFFALKITILILYDSVYLSCLHYHARDYPLDWLLLLLPIQHLCPWPSPFQLPSF